MTRKDWLVATLLALIFLFILSFIGISWLRTQAYADLPQGAADVAAQSGDTEDGVTALSAFVEAGNFATQWQADAQPVSATATIEQFNDLRDIYGGKTSWMVIYYSPIAKAVAYYTVTESGVGFLNAKEIDDPLLNLDLSQVTYDSNHAMTIAVSNGGEPLFEGVAERVALLRLELAPSTGRPEWSIFIQNETTGAHQTFRIDAETGQIFE